MFLQCQPTEAVEQFAGHVYIQHNPDVGDGKQVFIEYFECVSAEYAGKHVEVIRAFATATTWSSTPAKPGTDRNEQRSA
jgi:predicted SnoaL-like aldol condensation-catalyzing enzyme